MTRVHLALIAGYFVMIGLLGYGMIQARHWATTSFDDALARGDWQQFREDVVEMNETSSVRRRVPKSDEPPALVLMRDHFTVCVAISAVLSSALYGTFVLFILGSLKTSPGQA